jgi:hypothetical protein
MFAGGHQKVHDYFQHLLTTQDFAPFIYFTPDSRFDISNPWRDSNRIVGLHELNAASALFLGGTDWAWLDKLGLNLANRLVINIVQGVRHADPGDDRFQFLRRPAFRVCVSPEVGQALAGTGIVNGPIAVIPNAVNVGSVRSQPKQIDIFIGGLKNPQVATEIASLLQGHISVDCCSAQIIRDDFLRRMANAKVAILLPTPTEGFFLPALEAMALNCVPVVPDCIGNRSFCFDGQNCLMPRYSARDLAAAAAGLLASPGRLQQMMTAASATAESHSLDRERKEFLDALRIFLRDSGTVF